MLRHRLLNPSSLGRRVTTQPLVGTTASQLRSRVGHRLSAGMRAELGARALMGSWAGDQPLRPGPAGDGDAGNNCESLPWANRMVVKTRPADSD